MPVTINGTTGIAGVDGSAGTPAVQGADSNTGIFFPAADTIAFAEGGVEVARIDSSGNVGIGVTPASFATVKALQLNTASTMMAFTDELDIAQNVYYNAGNKYITSAAASMYVQTGGQHLWYRAASGTAGNAISFSESARIDSSGNLLVGTTSVFNAGKMSLYFGGTAGRALTTNDTDNNSTANHLTFYRNGTQIGTIAGNGGTGVSYSSSSDYRLKEDVRPLQGALARVALLKPCAYKWKDTGKQWEGFIAHELQEVVPDAVTGEKDAVNEDGSIKPQGIDTSFLVATLTAAIQEQQALIESLTARIAALEAA